MSNFESAKERLSGGIAAYCILDALASGHTLVGLFLASLAVLAVFAYFTQED